MTKDLHYEKFCVYIVRFRDNEGNEQTEIVEAESSYDAQRAIQALPQCRRVVYIGPAEAIEVLNQEVTVNV